MKTDASKLCVALGSAQAVREAIAAVGAIAVAIGAS
jgi:hypothetical protein